MVEKLLVLMQQRLALGPVGDGHRNLRPQLGRRGETTPAGADDAQLVDALERGVPGRQRAAAAP